MKTAQEANAAQVKAFITPYVTVIEYSTATLVKMLSDIAAESSETVSSDFQPDVNGYRCTILKDGNVAGGEQIIRIGSSKEWEFHVSVVGNAYGGVHKDLDFQISAGKSAVYITNERIIAMGNTGQLLVFYRTGEKSCLVKSVHQQNAKSR
jgi:hypothetical protein